MRSIIFSTCQAFSAFAAVRMCKQCPETMTGRSTSRFASLVNMSDAVTRRTMTKNVTPKLNLSRRCCRYSKGGNKIMEVFSVQSQQRGSHAEVCRLKGRMS